MRIERRLYVRVKFRWPVIIFTNQKLIEGITRNVSVDGALIYYSQSHAYGLALSLFDSVRLVIRVPHHLPLLIGAEVMWSDILSSDEANITLGIGVKFREVFHKDAQFLHNETLRYHNYSEDMSEPSL